MAVGVMIPIRHQSEVRMKWVAFYMVIMRQ